MQYHSINDDDWYEFNPATKQIIKNLGKGAYRSYEVEIKLPDGNIAVRGLRMKSML